ncbi:hypothetical protein MBT84_26215 [Streptomyces sp. MBT84]|uniref:DUF6233 domain-containing protein n=1 Tax=unclassified Streptomyces TaxID=2593676 RepID=UPI001D7FE391|nr:DUF6233 domain-containing protein [Streptomyces sp. MBT84]MBW8703097.1 hypothetical protein [Streptomyces sp. MBT84]
MNDSAPSKLDLLHFAHRVVVQQATAALAQIDGWIAQEGERETRQRQAEEMRPPPPEWLLERDLNKTNLVAAHVGDCWTVRKSSRCIGVSQAEALGAPRQQVPACTHCRPDPELGFLEEGTVFTCSFPCRSHSPSSYSDERVQRRPVVRGGRRGG